MRDKVLFGGLLVVYSVLLFAAIAWLSTVSSVYNPTLFQFLVPAVAAMAAAVGVGWRRKVAFIAATLIGFFLIDALAALVGIKELAGAPIDLGGQPVAATLALLYGGFVVIYPLAALVLFVGRDPRCLWNSAGRA